MSAEATAWAWRQKGLTPSERTVLLAICDVVNAQNDFEYWAGEEVTADKVEMSPRQMRRICGQLEDKGFITVDRRGARRTNLITVPVPREDKSGHPERTKVVTEKPIVSPPYRTQATQQRTQLPTPSPLAKTEITNRMDELIRIFGEPTIKGGWARYQQIVTLAADYPLGEITRRAQNHSAGLGFALTPGSLKKRWDELGGAAADLNTLTLNQRKEMLARSRLSDEIKGMRT